MRIAHVISGLTGGGAEATLYRLCRADRDDQHTVISMTDEGVYGARLQGIGVRLISLNMPRGRLSLSGLVRLWRLFRHERYDVVQTWMYHADLIGGLVARLAGVRRVFWGIRHSNLEAGHSSRSSILAAKLCARLSSALPSAIICCAEKAAEAHRRMGYRADRCLVIPNGYDLESLSPDLAGGQAWRTSLGISVEATLVGMIGRFDPQKDHRNFLAGLARLRDAGRDVQGLLVGAGLDQRNDTLMAWVRELGLQERLHLLGQRDDIPAILNALDLHVLSSSSEGFPNVVAEAMACGTPCVATDVGDARRIIGDTGWVVPPRDSGALGDAMGLALDEASRDPDAWQRRRLACRQRIGDRYGVGRMAAAYRHAWLAGRERPPLALADEG